MCRLEDGFEKAFNKLRVMINSLLEDSIEIDLSGKFELIFSPSAAGMLFHETIGHALESDFLYANQGFKWNKDAIEENYLLIPLKVKLYMPYILKGLNIFAGPQLDLCIKRNDWIWLLMSGEDGAGTGKQNIPYQNTLASITFGLGYRFDFGLDLAFSYNAGIVSYVLEYSEKICVFQLTAGYDLCKLFKLCGKK